MYPLPHRRHWSVHAATFLRSSAGTIKNCREGRFCLVRTAGSSVFCVHCFRMQFHTKRGNDFQYCVETRVPFS